MRITRHPLLAPVGGLREIPPDEAVIARLEGSFALAAVRGTELADRFYGRLFAEHPGLRPMFPEGSAAMEALKSKLLATLAMVVGNLRDPAAVRRRLHELGRRHAEIGVLRAHYPIVVRLLVSAMGETIGERWSEPLAQEWTRALELVAAIMLEADPTSEHGQRDDTHRGPVTVEQAFRRALERR